MKNTITTSLELSKALKEAGFKQESHFKWCVWSRDAFYGGEQDKTFSQDEWERFAHEGIPQDSVFYSAPTAEEILEELPGELRIGVNDMELSISKTKNEYFINYKDINDMDNGGFNDTEYIKDKSLANALAKMYLYLKEKGVL